MGGGRRREGKHKDRRRTSGGTQVETRTQHTGVVRNEQVDEMPAAQDGGALGGLCTQPRGNIHGVAEEAVKALALAHHCPCPR